MESSVVFWLTLGGLGFGLVVGFFVGYTKSGFDAVDREIKTLARQQEIRNIASEQFQVLIKNKNS